MIVGVDVPNPVDVVTGAISQTTGWAWDKVAEGITKWILGAVAYFVDGVVNFLLTSARPDVESAWFAGAGSPYATVRNIAGITLAVFAFLGLIQGLLVGDIGGMVRRIAVDLPLAILGMIATTVVVGRMVELTDSLSAAVLSNADGQAVHFLSGFGVAVTGATQTFAAVLLGLVAVLAAFFVWVELMVRSVLIYILVAVSPLSFAAMVWPAARSVLRRTVSFLAAVILSKLMISIALAVGVAALSSAGAAGQQQSGALDAEAISLGTLTVGTAVLGLATFAPFLLLKLIPAAESAVVAYGVSRAPVRGAQSTMGNVNYLSSVRRLAGGRGPRGGGPVSASGSGAGSAAASPGGGAGSARLAGSAPVAGAAVVATGAMAAVKHTAKTASGAVDAAGSSATHRSSPTRPSSAPRSPDAQRSES